MILIFNKKMNIGDTMKDCFEEYRNGSLFLCAKRKIIKYLSEKGDRNVK